MPRNIATCCKEKAVLVAVYEEKPRKRKLTTRNKNGNIKQQHHHHHHHHHLVQRSKSGEGSNRRAELLSYSQHLRESSKSGASASPDHHPKSSVASSAKDEQTMAMVRPVHRKRKLKTQSSCLHLDNIFKRFAISHAKRKMKNKKKQSNKSSTKKANSIMKTFNARTQKGTRRFLSKLMAIIQKYR